jgi:hypothetical protein
MAEVGAQRCDQVGDEEHKDSQRLWNVKADLQHLTPDEIQQFYIDHANTTAVGCLNLSGDINIGNDAHG